MNDKTIYLMRHGETIMNRAECLQGQIDCELNETGISEAQKAARILEKAGIRFDLAYTSPLRRARATAQIVSGGCELRVEPLITEMHFGSYEGMPYRDIDDPMWAFIHDPEHVSPPDGVESIQSLIGRTGKALTAMISGGGERVLAVTHGIALRAMLRNLYDGEERNGVWSLPIENCVIYEVSVRGGRPVGVRRADELALHSDSDTSAVF